ncbi:MAG TPA: hypothetical protein PKW99_14345 [Thauera sp.]|jgi:hypothetical protein|nr:hypothetical protein [Thauera sp.]
MRNEIEYRRAKAKRSGYQQLTSASVRHRTCAAPISVTAWSIGCLIAVQIARLGRPAPEQVTSVDAMAWLLSNSFKSDGILELGSSMQYVLVAIGSQEAARTTFNSQV